MNNVERSKVPSAMAEYLDYDKKRATVVSK